MLAEIFPMFYHFRCVIYIGIDKHNLIPLNPYVHIKAQITCYKEEQT